LDQLELLDCPETRGSWIVTGTQSTPAAYPQAFGPADTYQRRGFGDAIPNFTFFLLS